MSYRQRLVSIIVQNKQKVKEGERFKANKIVLELKKKTPEGIRLQAFLGISVCGQELH